jgi:outer membrane protein W
MKQTVFTFIFILISLTFLSQTEKGLSLETKFDIFSKTGNITPNLKARYFFNEENALRVSLAVQYNDATNEIFEIDGEGVGSVQKTNSFTTLSLGYEKHFAQEKFSPYVGGEFLIGFGSNSTYGSRTDSVVFINDFNYSSLQKSSSFGVHVFTGVDIKLYKGLFVGTEIGFMFNNLNYKRGEYKTEDASSTTNASTATSIPSTKEKSLSLANMGVIRFGWIF